MYLKKNTKLDTKDVIEELENKLNDTAAAGMENVKASNKAQRAKKRAAKRVQRKKEWEEESEPEESEPEEVDDMEFEDGAENQPANMAEDDTPQVEEKTRRGRSGRRRGKGVLS